jgi:glycosyltransferase involved in cell wall biosynthesis
MRDALVLLIQQSHPWQSVTIGNDSLEVSVVMPCLDEAETVETCIRKAQCAIQRHNLSAEVIVADNGSTDGSQNIADRCGARVVTVLEKGYGSALKGGINASRGRFVIMGDADDSYDFSDLYPFVEKLREGYDLVMGTRLKGRIMPGAMPWLNRWLGNPVLTGIGRLFFACPVSDFHCGLRAFSKEAYHRMNLVTTGMEFASEMVVKASFLALRITEVPITFYRDRRPRPPHLRRWRDAWRHLRFMLLYSPRWLFLVPGAFLFLFGGMLCIWLLPGPRNLGGVSLDVHTLLVGGLACILGSQLISFAVFAKVFAVTEGLLPEDPRVNQLFRLLTLEVGLAVGVLTTLVGIGLLVYAVFLWGQKGFGPLDYRQSMRLVIPAVTLLILGVQTVFSSFFLSILRLARKQK